MLVLVQAPHVCERAANKILLVRSLRLLWRDWIIEVGTYDCSSDDLELNGYCWGSDAIITSSMERLGVAHAEGARKPLPG